MAIRNKRCLFQPDIRGRLPFPGRDFLGLVAQSFVLPHDCFRSSFGTWSINDGLFPTDKDLRSISFGGGCHGGPIGLARWWIGVGFFPAKENSRSPWGFLAWESGATSTTPIANASTDFRDIFFLSWLLLSSEILVLQNLAQFDGLL